MSRTISLIACGAPAALMGAATTLISKATRGAVTPVITEAAEQHAVVVGAAPPSNVYASVVRPPAHPSAAYAGILTTVVRAILPREQPANRLQMRDILDVYPSSGIDCTAEEERASSTFVKAARLATELAKEQKATRLTLVIKPASKYENLNNIFLKAATEVAESAGLTTEVVHTAKAANELVVFPERHAVVLTNDDPVCENMQRAFAGVVGGAPEQYYTESGGCISGGASYRSVALAIAQELKNLGLRQEAEKVLAVVAKDPRKVEL